MTFPTPKCCVNTTSAWSEARLFCVFFFSICILAADNRGSFLTEAFAQQTIVHTLSEDKLDQAYKLSIEGFDGDIERAVGNAHWVDATRIAYVVRRDQSHSFKLYDLVTNRVLQPLDEQPLAKNLSAATGEKYKPTDLPLHTAKLQSDGKVHLSAGTDWYACDKLECVSIGRRELHEGWQADGLELDRPPSLGPVKSPNGEYSIGADAHDLFLITHKDRSHRALTKDGTELNAYANGIDLSWAGAHVYLKRIDWTQSPSILWSPDSQQFVSFQLDQRRVRRQVILDTSSDDSFHAKPTEYVYPYAMAGDAQLPRLTPIIVNVETEKVMRLANLEMVGRPDPIALRQVQWSPDSTMLHIVQHSKDNRSWQWQRVAAKTGLTEKLYEESFKQVPVLSMPPVTVLPSGQDAIIWSQRDDFGRLYRYSTSGTLLNTVNTGNLFVHGIVQIIADGTASPWIYFLAGEEADGVNPHDVQLYRVRADGTDQRRLGHIDMRQSVEFSPDGEHYFAIETRADEPTHIAVYTADGTLAHRVSGRWKNNTASSRPERFKIDLGGPERDVYGVLYPPTKIEPGKTYPIVHYVYGGAFTIDQKTSIGDWGNRYEVGYARGLNELGFGVVFYDGQGTANRRYSFNQYPEGKGYEHCNLEDAKDVFSELAKSYDWIDVERIGIAGWSNGGYCSLRGMLSYSHVYKVAISIAGNHDQRLQHFSVGQSIDPRSEGEKAWQRQSNLPLLDQLKGPVLLIQGEIDESVMPVNTLRVVERLTQLGKHFEMLYLPGQGHGFMDTIEIITKRQYRFLYQHLTKQSFDK